MKPIPLYVKLGDATVGDAASSLLLRVICSYKHAHAIGLQNHANKQKSSSILF